MIQIKKINVFLIIFVHEYNIQQFFSNRERHVVYVILLYGMILKMGYATRGHYSAY